MSAAQTRTALTSYRVDLIDKNDRWRIFLGLVEKVPYAACADTDKHFDKVGAAHVEERDAGFACDRSRQKRFTAAWRT
jgi:hypothetical protein